MLVYIEYLSQKDTKYVCPPLMVCGATIKHLISRTYARIILFYMSEPSKPSTSENDLVI